MPDWLRMLPVGQSAKLRDETENVLPNGRFGDAVHDARDRADRNQHHHATVLLDRRKAFLLNGVRPGQ